MSTNINSTEQIVEINAGDQITNVNIVSQSTTQVISGEQVVTVDVNAGTIPAAWGSITGTLSNQTDLQNALNAKQNNITLTTTGTTGVATLVGATLNIPNYVSSTKQAEWDSAYNDKINSAEVSGTTTKTLTLTQQDGGIIQASWSDFDTAPVTSVFGRTGDVVATEGDYNINQLGDVTITSATNGQVLKYNGTAWVNAADASGLTSVGLAMPSAFTVSGSPLTSNGTITVTGAGTTSQYVRGDGSLAAFPSVSNEAKTLIREVYNKTGATLTKGTVIYIDGGQGNLPTVTKAIATGDPTSAQTFGIVQSDITNMNNGFVVVAGGIDNIDTQAYTEGTALYLSPTTAGAWTSTKPYAPDHMVYLGVVVRSHPTQGVIEVKIQNGVELDEIHDVSARFPTNKDGIFYNSTSGVWENKSIAGVLGYTPVPESRIITINGTAQNLSADRTWNVGTVTSVAASGGTGISISGSPVTGSGTINITNTAPDQIVSLTGAGTTSISGTYPNFTVTSNDQYVGTVTSVNATVPTGFEVSGVPITSSGTVDIKFASGYSLPTTAKQGQWDDAYAKRIDSLTVTGNSGSATLTSNVLNVPTYTLTGLGGEPAITAGTTSQYWRGDKSFQTLDTSVVPENGNVYFTEPRVRATVLSGLNITGGSISASDSVLNAFGKVQNQINGLIGGSIFQSTWNASTNTPSLASGVGTKGYYYIVSVAGTTNLDGITDWQIGDWAIFDGTVWRKVDNTDAVVSVNGYTGVVNLVLDDLADVSAASPTDTQLLRYNGTTSKWYNWTPTFEPALTKGNLTEATSSVLTITGGSNAVIGSGTTIQVKQSSATGSGFLSSTDWTTFNNKQNALTNPVTGTGNTNRIAKFTSNGSAIGNANIFDDGTSVVVNHNAKINIFTTSSAQYSPLEIITSGTLGASVSQFSADTGGGYLIYTKSRNATTGSHTVVQNGDLLGNILFRGSDGTNYIDAARIYSAVDATVGTDDVRAALYFQTGTGSNTATRLQIASGGTIRFNSYSNNGFVKFINSDGTIDVDTNTYITGGFIGTTALQTSSANQALTGITGITFVAEASDSASITSTISGTSTFFDFNLSDDNNNDEWRWRFTPSGGTVYNAMRLVPTTNTTSNLIVSGTISASNFSGSSSGTNTGDQDLSGYVTLGTAQTITAVKTFNENIRINTDTNPTSLTGKQLVIRASSSNVGQSAMVFQGYDKTTRWVLNVQTAADEYNYTLYSNTVTIGDSPSYNAKFALTQAGVLRLHNYTTNGLAAFTGGDGTISSVARTINGTTFDGSSNITITANTTNSITFDNSGSGAASGTTFNGSTARTISYNTIGAQAALTNPVTGTGTINYIAKFTATGSTVGNSTITNDGRLTAFSSNQNDATEFKISNTTAGTSAQSYIYLAGESSARFFNIGKVSSTFTPQTWLDSGDGYLFNGTGNISIYNSDGIIKMMSGGVTSSQFRIQSSIPISVGNGTTNGGRYEFYRNSTPTAAGSIGNGFSGTISDDTVIATYNATSNWIRRVTIVNNTTGTPRVSIGGTSPDVGLTIEGSTVADTAIGLKNTSVDGGSWYIYSTGTGYAQGNKKLLFYRAGDGNGGAAVLDWDGNLVLGAVSVTPRDTGARTFEIYGGTSGRSAIKFTNSTSGTGNVQGAFIGYDDALNFDFINNASGQIKLSTSNALRFYITSGGDVIAGQDGAATTARLTSYLGSTALVANTSNDGLRLQVQSYNDGARNTIAWGQNGSNLTLGRFGIAWNNGTSQMCFVWRDMYNSGAGSTEIMRLTGAGNLGIGVDPSERLSVKSADNTSATNIARFAANNNTLAVGIGYETIRQTETNNALFIKSNGTGVLYLNYDVTGNIQMVNGGGKVGVGVSPTAKLEVKYDGNNGNAGAYGDYNILATSATTSQSYQATIGAIHTGGGYANLNLGDTDSGTTRFWHISKRISSSNDQGAGARSLTYYWNDGTGFSAKFSFSTGGNLYASGGYFESSDIRLKSVIERNPLIDLNVDVIKFKKHGQEGIRYGYSAQEVQAIAPELVTDGEYLQLNYTDVHTLKIAKLEAEVKSLKEQLKNK